MYIICLQQRSHILFLLFWRGLFMGFSPPLLFSLLALCITPSGNSLRLLYANRKDIRIVRTSSKNPNETFVVDGLEDAIAVDFCFAEGFVFWTDVTLGKIKRIRVTGDTRKVEDVIWVGPKKSGGLAVDWIAKKLYWTDCGDSKWSWETNNIEVANLDGTNRKVLFSTNLGLPRAIAVDPLKGFMFWSDSGKQPKIERAEMDGSNRAIIIRQNIHLPNGLTIDYSAGKIYWTDAKLFYIAKANYDGSGRQKIFRTPMPSQCVLGLPFALTLYENNIYWTDGKTRGIHSTNKNNSTRCQMVWSNASSPMDIHAFEPRRQLPRPGQNPCNSTSNGGCSHLCLLNAHGHSCACPTGEKLLSDGKTCKRIVPYHDVAATAGTAHFIPITEGPSTASNKKTLPIIWITVPLSILFWGTVCVFLQRFIGRRLRNQTYDNKNPEPGVTFTRQKQEEDQLENVHDCIDNNQSFTTSQEREEELLSGQSPEEDHHHHHHFIKDPLFDPSGVESPVKKRLQTRQLPPIPQIEKESQRMEQNSEHNETCLRRLQSESQNPNFQARDACTLDSKGRRGNVLEEQDIPLNSEKSTGLIAVLPETENQPSRGSLNEREAETRTLLSALGIDVSPWQPRKVRESLSVPDFGAAHLGPSKRRKETKYSSEYNISFSINSQEIKQDYDIDLRRLEVQNEVLGEGEFGVVYKGRYHCKDKKVIDVAVKQLKDTAGMAEKVALLREIKMLKLVGRHPNIINLVGACTEGENILMVTDLIPGGTLESLLTSKLFPAEHGRYANVKCALNDRELMKIALQIASGMQHLESKKCIHGDLAARNVFIDENKVAKLGDFGLARDISEGGIYNKTSNGKVPWRWLSLESLRFLVYTSQSDVWSFGILLWEIVTFGELPYPDIATPWDLKCFLSSGRRMPRPDHCTEEVYALMQSCWMENPLMRPTFEDITKQIRYLLRKKTRTYVNVQHDDITDDSKIF